MTNPSLCALCQGIAGLISIRVKRALGRDETDKAIEDVNSLHRMPADDQARDPSPATTRQGPEQPTARPPAARETTPQRERQITSGSLTESSRTHGNLFTTNRFEFANYNYGFDGYTDYLAPNRFKVLDFFSACPQDRCFFQYQHFANSLETCVCSNGVFTRRFDVNLFNFGFEKTFGVCRNNSLEVRLPIYATGSPVFSSRLSNLHGTAGNLSLIAKRIL